MKTVTIGATALYWNTRTLLAWSLALVAFVYFALTNSSFLNQGNLYALIQLFSTLVLVATGLALVMIAAQFDLSVAGTYPLAGLVAVQAAEKVGVLGGIALAIGLGVVIGFVNGWLTAAFRIPSLAVTVATMVLAIGIGYVVSGSQLVQMTNYDASLRLTSRVLGSLSVLSIVQLAVVLLAYAWVKYSWWGRFIYAVGSDTPRARSSGLPVNFILTLAFIGCGSFVALGGALQGISLASAQAGPNESFLLQSATAALIGGIALTGGRGSIVGVFGGAFLLAVLSNGLGLAGTASAIIQLVNGVVLLTVVLIDKPLNRLIDLRMRAEAGTSIDTRTQTTVTKGT